MAVLTSAHNMFFSEEMWNSVDSPYLKILYLKLPDKSKRIFPKIGIAFYIFLFISVFFISNNYCLKIKVMEPWPLR